MNIDSVKRIVRGWLPPQPSNLQKIRNYSTPIAIGLLITVVSLSAFIVSSSLISGYSTVQPPPAIPTVGNTASEQNVTESLPALRNITLLTREQALAIADPIIQQYARENNRIVTNLNISDHTLMMADLQGKRGGPTLEQVLGGNVTASGGRSRFMYYPVWTISATFQWEEPQLIVTYDTNGTVYESHWPSGATWINGYDVVIWADTGQIASSNARGIE